MMYGEGISDENFGEGDVQVIFFFFEKKEEKKTKSNSFFLSR